MAPTVFAQFLDDVHRGFRADDPGAGDKAREAGHVDRLLAMYAAVGRGDLAAVVAAMTDDVAMEIAGPPGHPFNGSWAGRQEVLAALARNFSMVCHHKIEVRSVVAQGDLVAVFGRESGAYTQTGDPYRCEWAQLFTFRGDQVAAVRELFATT